MFAHTLFAFLCACIYTMLMLMRALLNNAYRFQSFQELCFKEGSKITVTSESRKSLKKVRFLHDSPPQPLSTPALASTGGLHDGTHTCMHTAPGT